MTIRRLLNILVLTALLSASAGAESIPGTFSDRAGTDSLELLTILRIDDPDATVAGAIYTLGDITGDGCSDILATINGSSPAFPSPSFLFLGGQTPPAQFIARFDGFSVHMAEMGDVNADGFPDLGGYYLYPQRFSIFLGGPDIDDRADWSVANHVSMAAMCADLNADGVKDIPVSVNLADGDVNVFAYQTLPSGVPDCTISDTASNFGFNLAVGEFNGDGYDDLAIVVAGVRTPVLIKFYWGGPAFDTVADLVISIPNSGAGHKIVPLKDFNGDGYGDLLVSGVNYGSWGIYFGGPNIDAFVDARFPAYDDYIRLVEAVGDINNDGLDDIVAAYSRVNHHEPASSCNIYLGGEIVHEQLTPDAHIDGLDIPGLQTFTTGSVSGIGDFNGDGLNDFAISSQSLDSADVNRGAINIFSGWEKSVTDVPYDFEPTLPDNYQLAQNYPNPFNPSTTIQFALPAAGQTRLAIFNMLGRRVTTLIDNHLAAGSYTLTWNGTSATGEQVASGVYVYRLQSGDYVTSRKMVLAR